MPRVTAVEPQTLRLRLGPNRRFNIFLDGEFAFGADEDLVVEWRLIPGKVLDTPDVERLLFEAEVGKLMERMYRLFNIRQRSEKEVKDYLRNLSFKRKVKGQEEISEAAIALLINKLKQKGLLSDEQFAKAWVQSRRKTKNKGKIALKAELYQKGINRDLIEEVLEEESTPESEKQLAQQALMKKMKTWKSLPLLKFKKKSYEFLLRRGFEYEVVREVIENYLNKR
ncbi:RecX family transcriptional regulator [Candidatus Daviesbacteria bacterium]|nr:RecX family transcriptional regulator [Candidatus Daviesbacteria bacterium]